MSLLALTAEVIEFREQRNWAQFHNLRNLIVSLNLEASELLELTQWKSDADMAALAEDARAREALHDECADVLIYLLLIAENAGIDLEAAARAKLAKNAVRYPVELCFGSSRKYAADTANPERSDGLTRCRAPVRTPDPQA